MSKKKKFEFPANTPEWIKRIDFTDLRGQKTVLIKLADAIRDTPPQPYKKDGVEMALILMPKETEDVLEGILSLIDALQDYAVDELGVPEMHVFDFELEENRELSIPTGIKAAKGGELKEGDTIKKLWLCPYCGSDNVDIKKWVNANSDEVGTDCEEENGYCNDCKEHGELILCDVKADAEIVGFQVVDDEAGDIHPDMDGSFCLYSLSQAEKMLHSKHDEGDWKLLAVWTGDVEEPTIMFEGNPRD